MLKSNIEGLRAEKEGIKVTYKTGDRKKQDVVIEPKPRPGQLGRINAREFFGHTSNAYTITGQVPIFVPEDCHHRNQITISDELVDVLDVYGSLANSFIGAKERAYRHTRKVNEIGISYRQGNDPITAVIVILAAVAAALVIAGAVIEIGCAAGAWSGDVCNWGWGLIFAGIVLGGIVCVAAGACDFVIALLLHIIV